MGGSLSPALFEARAERRDRRLLRGGAVLGLLAPREPAQLVPAVVFGEFARVALFVGADVVEARVSRSRSLPRELVGGGGEACRPSDGAAGCERVGGSGRSDVAARCERVGSGREAQEREFDVASSHCALRLCRFKRVCGTFALILLRKSTGKLRFLHELSDVYENAYCETKFECFKLVAADLQRRTEH